MPPEANEQISYPLTPDTGGFDIVQERTAGQRLKMLGKNALAVAGMSLAFMATEPTSAQAYNNHGQPVAHTISNAGSPNASTGPETVTNPVYSGPFEVGVDTYSELGDDPGHLFSDMHHVGMTGVRLNLVRENEQFDLMELHKEIAEATRNDIDVTVLLEEAPYTSLAGYPKWAAQMAAQLPGVHRFVINNEVNSPYFWPCVAGTPRQECMKQYVDSLYQSTKAVHTVRPDALVSGFGLASGYGPLEYLEQASQYAYDKYGGLQNIEDTLSVHLYRSPIASLLQLKQYELIWPDEINIDEAGQIVAHSGQSWQRPYYVSPLEQARNEMYEIDQLQQDPQVENVFNNRFMDSADPSDNYKTGLLTSKGVKRPLYGAMESSLLGSGG